jgi:hypothetical protein
MQPTPVCEIVRKEKRQRALRYREEAARLEAVARTCTGQVNRSELLEMATQYEGLARRLEADLAVA